MGMLLRNGKLFSQLQKANLKLFPGVFIQQKKFYSTNQSQADNWEPIYKLPLIQWAAAFNKIKIYQYIVTALSIPLTLTLESYEYIPESITPVVASLGLTGCVTLTTCSLLTSNLIGIIYVNETEGKMRLAYVDFWGARKQVDLLVADVIPFSEMPTPKQDIYRNVQTVNSKKPKYRLLHTFGNVLNRTKFLSIFGE